MLDTDYLRGRWPNNPLWGISPLYSNNGEPAEVEVVSGACLMIKRAVFETVSLFSEEYFMYAEDLDLCYKVKQDGFTNYYVGEGTVIHYGGKSSEPQSATMMKWRAIPQFCDKNHGRFWVHFPIRHGFDCGWSACGYQDRVGVRRQICAIHGPSFGLGKMADHSQCLVDPIHPQLKPVERLKETVQTPL